MDSIAAVESSSGNLFQSLTLRPSRFFQILYWGIHSLVVILSSALYLESNIPLVVLLTLLVLVCISAALSWSRYVAQLGTQLCFNNDRWQWWDTAGVCCQLALHEALIWPGLTILYMRREAGERLTLVIFYDAADASELRRLRVWLRNGN